MACGRQTPNGARARGGAGWCTTVSCSSARAARSGPDWTAELERCAKCRSAHLIRRLGQVECLDCGLVQDAEATLVPAGAPDAAGRGPAAAGPGPGHDAPADTSLADEVSRALDRLLGRA